MSNVVSERSKVRQQLSQASAKAELLSHGIALSERFIQAYGLPYLEKRRAYGNSDPVGFMEIAVPQELYLFPSGIVCSVNIRPASHWTLDFENELYFLSGPNSRQIEVSFPLRPAFYDLTLQGGEKANSVATLYGGGALGIFVYGTCALVEKNAACKYCSIKPNRQTQVEFVEVVTPQQAYEVVKLSLAVDGDVISQIMINGGNFKNNDKSFKYYIEICSAARKAIDESGADIEIHLIAHPPQEHSLFDTLADIDVSVAMNMEVYTPEKFSYYCPGKDQQQILSSLKSASKSLGAGKVFSIFVGGLESIGNMEQGFNVLSEAGVIPIINVFHPDPGTDLEVYPAPRVEEIMAMGKLLQKTYENNNFMRPFYLGCGRNAIDTEAYRKLF